MATGNQIMFTNVRVSFPTLVQAEQTSQQNPQKYYAMDLLFPQTNPAWAQFWAEIERLAQIEWADQAAAVLQMINADRKKRCYGDGSERLNQRTMEPLVGYPGNFYITAKEKEERGRPTIVDSNGQPIDKANTMAEVAEARRFYGGCRANVLVSPWTWDNSNGRGISCNLLAIQFAADDEPFGESTVVDTSGFGAVATPAGGAPGPGGAPGTATGGFGSAPAGGDAPQTTTAADNGMPGGPTFGGGNPGAGGQGGGFAPGA
jgi:hypothetical protein